MIKKCFEHIKTLFNYLFNLFNNGVRIEILREKDKNFHKKIEEKKKDGRRLLEINSDKVKDFNFEINKFICNKEN